MHKIKNHFNGFNHVEKQKIIAVEKLCECVYNEKYDLINVHKSTKINNNLKTTFPWKNHLSRTKITLDVCYTSK